MPNMTTPRVLWVALFASTLMNLGVVYYVAAQRTEALVPDSSFLPIFGVIALVSAAMSALLPRRLHAQAATKAAAALALAPTEGLAAVPGLDGLAARKRFADPKAARQTALQVFLSPFIVGMALAESVCLLGFVLGFLGHDPLRYLPFFVASWALMLTRFPTPSEIYGSFERVTGTTLAGD